MKPVAIILILLCVASIACVGWLYVNTSIIVEGYGCTACDAVQMADSFNSLKAASSHGAFTGTAFQLSDLGEAEDYQFYVYTLHLRNNSFLNAEVVEVQVTPMTGDIAQLPVQEEQHLASHSSGDFTATILTSKGMHNVRELTVSYYLWGLPFSAKVTYSSL